MGQRRVARHRQTDIKIVRPREEPLVELQGHRPFPSRRHRGVLSQQDSIGRMVENALSPAVLRHAVRQSRRGGTRAEHRSGSGIKHPYSLDERQVASREIDRNTGHPLARQSRRYPEVENDVIGPSDHHRNGRFVNENDLCTDSRNGAPDHGEQRKG